MSTIVKKKFNELIPGASVDEIVTAMTEVGGMAQDAWSEALNSTHCQNLLHQYLWPRCAEEYAFIKEYEEDNPSSGWDEEVQVSKIGGWIFAKNGYYKKMLDLYESQADSLMKQVSSKFGYSDMPQSALLDDLGTAGNDDLTRARVQLADMATPMGRLEEIQTAYRNLMEDWAREFIETFVIYE